MATREMHALVRPVRGAVSQTHPVISKFFADRGPHLSAMVAYYALLSFVPFLFLAVSLLGFAGRLGERSYLVRELRHVLPGASASDLLGPVHSIQQHAGTLGILGLLGIVWASLGFYSALESALNIVFRVQNRAFLHQKTLTFALVLGSLVVLFASLLLAAAATGWVARHASHLVDLSTLTYIASLVLSILGAFLFLLAVYGYLTNVPLGLRDVWPGALFGTLLFQCSFQALPLYLRFSGQLVALRAFGGLVILLVWLYLMANIILLGSEINYVRWRRRQVAEEAGLAGLA